MDIQKETAKESLFRKSLFKISQKVSFLEIDLALLQTQLEESQMENKKLKDELLQLNKEEN